MQSSCSSGLHLFTSQREDRLSTLQSTSRLHGELSTDLNLWNLVD